MKPFDRAVKQLEPWLAPDNEYTAEEIMRYYVLGCGLFWDFSEIREVVHVAMKDDDASCSSIADAVIVALGGGD